MPAQKSDPFIIKPQKNLLANHPKLVQYARNISSAYTDQVTSVSEEYIKEVGEYLWRAVAQQSDLKKALYLAGNRILPLIIDISNPDLLWLPWETMYDADLRFIALNPRLTLTRRVRQPSGNQAHPPPGPLRVLWFSSLPDDVDPETERLDLEMERQSIVEAMQTSIEDGLVVLNVSEDGTFQSLKELVRHTTCPHLLVLTGHGRSRGNKFEFIFESADGKSDPKDESEIAGIFAGTHVQAILLLACESGKHVAQGSIGSSLAARLSMQGIPHVIGIREPIIDTVATSLVKDLCESLSMGEPIDVAIQRSRESISSCQRSSEGLLAYEYPHAQTLQSQWNLPVLYTLDPAKEIVQWGTISISTTQERESQDLSTRWLEPHPFRGRRSELRRYRSCLSPRGKYRQLLITAAGGQGKTAVAHFLARYFVNYHSYEWLELGGNADTIERQISQMLGTGLDLEQPDSVSDYLDRYIRRKRLLITIDGLEAHQNIATRTLECTAISAVLEACKRLGSRSPLVLATSRWGLPEWASLPFGRHDILAKPLFGDFRIHLNHVTQDRASRDFARELYHESHGNFAALCKLALNPAVLEDKPNLTSIYCDLDDYLRLYTGFDQCYIKLPPSAQILLKQMRAFHRAVTEDGVRIISQGAKNWKGSLKQLVAYSLLDTCWEESLQTRLYILPRCFSRWLGRSEGPVSYSDRSVADKYESWMDTNLMPSTVGQLRHSSAIPDKKEAYTNSTITHSAESQNVWIDTNFDNNEMFPKRLKSV